MPIFRNTSGKNIQINPCGRMLSGMNYQPSDLAKLVAPEELFFGALSFKGDSRVTLITDGTVIGTVIASTVKDLPYGFLSLVAGSKTYRFTVPSHIIAAASMSSTNHEYYGQYIMCKILDATAAVAGSEYEALVRPNDLAVL